MDFVVSPDVETLWHRFCLYRADKEPLLSMAYFNLTVVKMAGGGRKSSAVNLNIEEKVLRKIGELTSKRGDAGTARKMSVDTQPLTDKESAWLVTAITSIIGHLAGPWAKALRMSDLPPV
jgi:hypothetical protein